MCVLYQRRGSLVAGGRPVTLELRRSSSLRRGSSESLLRRGGGAGGGAEEERRTYLQSRISATRLSQSLSRLSSSSLEQLLYDSSEWGHSRIQICSDLAENLVAQCVYDFIPTTRFCTLLVCGTLSMAASYTQTVITA